MNLAISMTWEQANFVLADMAIKGFFLLVLAALISYLLRNHSAAARHLTWLIAFGALLLLPAILLLAPQWRLPILPPGANENRPSSSSPYFPKAADQPAPPILETAILPDRHPEPLPPVSLKPLEQISSPPPRQAIPLARYTFLIALAGALFILGKLAIGLAIVARLRRKAVPLDQEPWKSLATRLSQSINLPRHVPVLKCFESTMPMAIGLFRPAILLPAESSQWSQQKLEMVLLHELAHIRRRDCPTNVLAHIALALHWFNPLAWLAIRRLVAERELACDDVVLSAGSLPSRYADFLLDIARAALTKKTMTSSVAIPMARPTQLEGRLRAILDAARPRRAPTRRMIASSLIVTAILILPFAAVRLTTQLAKGANMYTPITSDSHPTSDITGTVNDETGHPLPNIKILAIHGWKPTADRQTTQTNPAGQFTFKNLQPGTWLFSADDPRYAWDWDHERGLTLPVLPENLPLPITLYTPRTLHGTVTNDAGQPVPNARVILVNQTLPGHAHPVSGHIDIDFLTTQTDPAGHFTLNRLRPGTAALVLEHPDYANSFTTATIDGSQPTFTIHSGLMLHGQVQHNGQPLAYVQVTAQSVEGSRLMVDWHAKTDALGRFETPRIPSRSGTDCNCENVSVWIDDAKWYSDHYGLYQTSDAALPPVTIDARPKESGKTPDLNHLDIGKSDPLPPGKTGTMTVHFPGLTGKRSDLFVISQALVEEPLQFNREIKNDTVVFNDLPPGKYMLAVGYTAPALPPKFIELTASQKLDVTLEPGPAQIHGTIHSDGKPVSGGFLSWFPSQCFYSGIFHGSAAVQPDGTYTITGLSEGDYDLIYQAPNSMSNRFTAKAQKHSVAFNIDLPSSRIEGKLVGIKRKNPDPDIPIGDIFIHPRLKAANAKCVVQTTPDGKFTVEHLPPGQYTVTGYDITTTAVIEREDSTVSLSLFHPVKTGEIAGTLKGRLPIHPSDNWSSIQVTAIPQDQHGYNFDIWTYTTYANPSTGAYRIRDLPPGTYGILIKSGGFEQRIPTLWFPDITVRENLSRELPIDIPDCRVISIDIPLPLRTTFQSWRLRLPSGQWLDDSLFSWWEFKLPLGDYTIEANYGSRGLATQTFTLQPGKDPQKITLPTPKPTTQPILQQ